MQELEDLRTGLETEMSIRCIFLGAPGSGKGTQAKKLQQDLKIPHISTGDMLRQEIDAKSELGNRVKEILSAGKLVDDALMIEVIKNRFSRDDVKDGFMLDGYPRTENQAVALEKILKESGLESTTSVYIHLDNSELTRRLLGRLSCSKCGTTFHRELNPPKKDGICDVCGTALVQRKDDTKETVLKRIEVFEKETSVLLDFYKKRGQLIEINGNQKVEKITADIRKALEV